MKRIYKYPIVFSTIVSLVVSILIGCIALKHNPQQSIAITEGDKIVDIDWPYMLLLMGSWFLPSFVCTLAVSLLPAIIVSNIIGRTKSRKDRNMAGAP